ncbi:MAG: hypothetical protein R2874_16190 [Desulfobacterales bacterium]
MFPINSDHQGSTFPGHPTWVSIEPVIDPDQAIKLVEMLHPVVDHWKVGKSITIKISKMPWTGAGSGMR